MNKYRHSKVNTILIVLIAGMAVMFLSNIVFRLIPTPSGFNSFFFMFVIIAWQVSFYERVPDGHTRKYMLVCTVLSVLLFVARSCRWNEFAGVWLANHLFWYSYYISFTGIPLFALFAAESIGTLENKKPAGHLKVLFVIWVILCGFFMTNDFHHLLLTIGVDGETTESYGILYLVQFIWAAVLFSAGFGIILHKCRNSASKKYAFVPFMTAILGTALLVWYMITGGAPHIMGVKLFNLQEAFVIPFIVFCELCIRIGLIPSNVGYESAFRASHLNAAVTDFNGNVVFHSADFIMGQASVNPVTDDSDFKFKVCNVPGGYISWTEDHSVINFLREELEDVTLRLEEENDIIKEENRIKEMNARYEAQNVLYDSIAGLMSTQLDDIDDELLKLGGSKENVREIVAHITLPGAYIKRRSNLELLKYRSSQMYVSELYFSVRESLEYLNINGCTCVVNRSGDCENALVSLDIIIAVYEMLDDVIRFGKGSMNALRVDIEVSDKLQVVISTDASFDIIQAVFWKWNGTIRILNACAQCEAEDETVYLTVISDVDLPQVPEEVEP